MSKNIDNSIMFNPEEMGKRIKALRKDTICENGKPMSQDKLAEELNKRTGFATKRSEVSEWETGNKAVTSLDKFLALCDIFACDPQYLLGKTNAKRIEEKSLYDLLKIDREAIKNLKEMSSDEASFHNDNIALSGILNDENFLSTLGKAISADYGRVGAIVGTEDPFIYERYSFILSPTDMLNADITAAISSLQKLVHNIRHRQGLPNYDETDHS